MAGEVKPRKMGRLSHKEPITTAALQQPQLLTVFNWPSSLDLGKDPKAWQYHGNISSAEHH